jgi:hypothetical protein
LHFYYTILNEESTYDNIMLSMISSLLAFFALSIIFTIKQSIDSNPQKLPIESKISLLINQNLTDKNPRQFEYIKDVIEDQLIFCPEYTYTVHFSDYREELGAFKAYVRTIRTLVNMSYEPLKNRPLHYSIFTDGVIDERGLQGELMSSRVLNGGKPRELFSCPQPIKNDKYEYTHSEDFKPGETKSVDTLYWLYHKIGAKFLALRSRYAYSLEITIENTTGKTIVVSNLTNGAILQLSNGGTLKIPVKRDVKTNSQLPTEIFSIRLEDDQF